jgi:uncharacterized membrane protein (UPF0182 family)
MLALALVLLFGSARGIADFAIEYLWWDEVDQIPTWFSILLYKIVPMLLASLLAWAALLWAHRRGSAFAGADTALYKLYRKLVPVILLVLSVAFIGSQVESWTVMAFAGSRGISAGSEHWVDPVFGRNLAFYLFDLPFLKMLVKYLFTLAFFVSVVFWISGRGWQVFLQFKSFRADGGSLDEFNLGPRPLRLPGATKTNFAKVIACIALAGAAAWFYLGQYGLLLSDHSFMLGMDYLDEVWRLPLRWFVVIALLLSIPLIATSRYKAMMYIAGGAFVLHAALPLAVQAFYVSPNELKLERDYIERHVQATRQAFAINSGKEEFLTLSATPSLDVEANATLIDNIRLWDEQAYTDTITQIQALRLYYRFADMDIDRYQIDGKVKQLLLSPREIDFDALSSEAKTWINRHWVYTHGYGVVTSEVNRTTPDGLPVLLIQDAPPEIKIADIRIEQPEIYYGELTNDPVFVGTDQEEFDYPKEDQNVTSRYAGEGGFPIHSVPVRLAAAFWASDYNILFTGLTNESSRMMIHRNVSDRLKHLASFIQWDPDPYLVITDEGRLVWILDGYTTSNAHPYSQPLRVGRLNSSVNYIRNSVKATVDAYHGTTRIYLFDDSDPIIQAYANLFPSLFHSMEAMPASIRAHIRYPELIFNIQAEIYRTFHMRDPTVFYNKEDIWDVGKSLAGSGDTAERMQPTYIVATLPGETEPEFLLMLPFTPSNKDNLNGWMAARCDGDNLGELIFYQLSKQELYYGPNQIEAQINQDQQIARDLTLWNQQGSRVLRGEMIAMPVGENFLYVESIYIQAESARMPQLRKVVLAMGDRLVYEDNFELALARLGELERADMASAPSEGPDAQPVARRPEPRTRDVKQRIAALRRQASQFLDELSALEREIEP